MAGIDWGVIYAGVGMFTAIVLALIAIILTARARLVSGGSVHIDINGEAERGFDTAAGGKLLFTLRPVQGARARWWRRRAAHRDGAP
jgi:Na+-transporting NADH:ubiquinone oxidoreductase subunit NqrF